jgi:hypothetical protein
MTKARCVLHLALALCLSLVLAPFGHAQDYRGKVQGIVTDQSQAVIANATVTLTNVNTGIKVVKQTESSGVYLFDLVDPGTYTVTVELPGFGKFTQENIVVQTRGDVTVNASLKPGSVQDSVTVTETPVAVEFNSANKDLTIDSKLVSELPRLDRNPFKLTLVAPSAVNTRGEMQPYHSWAANSVELGGGTNLKNDLLVDGSPLGMGQKNSVPPNQDAVQEVIVSTNSVDAESGHSAGGQISMTLKSGTNEWHGSAFYLGRYPWLNAMADRTRDSFNATRQNMMGGTLGNPILKNKLFNFFSLEYWKVGSPGSYVNTVPTALEQQGDFSQSLNADGSLRQIYDPFSTVVDAAGAVTRTAFPGNKIPASRMDPVAAAMMKQFWAPNNPGDNLTGVNNFKKGYNETYNYYNFADKVDYNISDKWRVFGRFSRYHTTDIAGDPTPNHSQLYQATGTLRGGKQFSGDAIWTVNPRTVVEFHGDYHDVIDAYVAPDLGKNGWSSIFPNNNFYQTYQSASSGVPVYYPALNIGGQSYGGPGFFWNQAPKSADFDAKISQQRGSHYLKAGFQHRRAFGTTLVTGTSQFYFPANLTAGTYNNPDLLHQGDQFATFLLGALDNQTEMIGGPAPDPHDEWYGVFFQDDWKVSRNITINLGLRDEYETAIHDPNHYFSQGLNLGAPVPEMQANPPQMPAQVVSILNGAGTNPSAFYHYTGQWQFTSGSHPGMWDPQKLALAPRAGIAYRIDDNTALRIGYARYYIPTEMDIQAAPIGGYESVGFLEPPFFGMTGYQYAQGLLAGVPQATLSNPFPSSNPLLPITGKGYGSNLGRGGQPLLWYPQNLQKAYNDRININLQRQIPGDIVLSGTWFMNFGNQQYIKYLNQIDPQLQVKYQDQLNNTVANPFYNYLTPTLVPGPLRNQKTVTVGSLLTPYPQYGGLYQIGTQGAAERYNQFEIKAQKAWSKGYNFLFAYDYIVERTQQFFNDQAQYLNDLTWQDSNQPRHRLNLAGTYELPIGKGKSYFGSMPKAADAILGGWKVAGLFTFSSGDYLRFGTMGTVPGCNPVLSNPSMQHWFNTSCFTQIPAGTSYMLRYNPYQYAGLTGPQFWNLDATLTKNFAIFERVHAEFKLAAYNATNHLNLGDPVTDVNSSSFGQALYQGSPGGGFGIASGTQAGSGRQVELGLKFVF